MKKIFLVLMAVTLVTLGCTDKEKLESGSLSRPNWQIPNYDEYEQIMTVDILLEEALQKYASENDLMCGIIDDEVRGVAIPGLVGEKWRCTLTLGSNESGQKVTLSYYCDELHQIYTTDWVKFDATIAPTGEGETYEPIFIK